MNQIIYTCDGNQAVWPVPFVVKGELLVSRIIGGIERQLQAGRDYLINDGQVFCVSAPGSKLRIVDTGAGAGVEASISSLSYAAGPVASSVEKEDLAREAARDTLIADLTGEVEDMTAKARAQIQTEAADAAGQIRAAQAGSAADLEEQLQKTEEFCQAMRNEAWAAADKARRSAVTATAKWRHGIAAVKSKDQIPFVSGGLFIVIPQISHAPTPFMGIWPARCPGKINYDGVFFIGPPYPDKPNIPGLPDPTLPQRPQGTGDADDWIPCQHAHFEPGCSCISCQTCQKSPQGQGK